MDKNKGHLHPLTIIIQDMVTIFSELGFSVAFGPEIESEENNFDLLNIPKDHPARDMWDTFFIKNEEQKVLRTHTSPVQIRYMRGKQPPFRIISPGKTFRYEATDLTHEAQFFQLEGLIIDKKTSLAELKGTLNYFLKKIFNNENIETRFRPSYFPFVEPGFEVDMSCSQCEKKGCSFCKQTGWIELLGAGMVQPNVLKNVGLDPKKYQGFAFGVGVDRVAMLKYRIDDIRLLYQGDLRLVNQF